jgi:hypothetical protein
VNIQKFYVLRKNAKKLFENRYEMKKQSEILLQELRKIVS